MKRVYLFLLLLCIAIPASCSKEKTLAFDIPKDYRLWKKPVKLLDYPVPGHGATYRVIYANDVSYKVKKNKDADGNDQVVFPDGSVIIKEVYKNRKDINWADPQLTIMVKESTNEYAQAGWLYFVRQPGEKQAKLLHGRMCIGCHEAANDKHPYFDGNATGIFRDYIFVNIAK